MLSGKSSWRIGVIFYLSVRPSLDAVLSANLFQDGSTNAQFLGNIVYGHVEVVSQIIE
jgi:hypothetical protein